MLAKGACVLPNTLEYLSVHIDIAAGHEFVGKISQKNKIGIKQKRLRPTTFFSVSQNNAVEFSKRQMMEQTFGI